jgi:hypothetical protein
VPDPRTEDGVCQQAHPVQLDQHGCVPDVEKPAGGVYAPIQASLGTGLLLASLSGAAILAPARLSGFTPSA